MKNTIINGKALPAMSIGTVQLGMNYGIANEGGQPSQEKSFAMLRTAFENGVASLDTARAYGNSEEVIGAFLKTWEGELPYITTKIRYKKAEGLSFEANAITSIVTEYLRIPAVMDTDKLCMQMCLRTCPDKGEPLKVMWTKDTLHMGEFYVSTSLKDEIEANPNLSTDGNVYEIEWDAEDNFVCFKAI